MSDGWFSLAATALPFLAACIAALVVDAWWPIQLVAVMLAVGLAFEILVYQRLLAYQLQNSELT